MGLQNWLRFPELFPIIPDFSLTTLQFRLFKIFLFKIFQESGHPVQDQWHYDCYFAMHPWSLSDSALQVYPVTVTTAF